LNLRQQANASLASFLLAATGWASWLVHLDSDESIHVRRAELEALPPSVRAVRLSVWEAVSSADAVDVRLFKRQLTASEEAVLHSLGHRRYFRGHRVGKTAVRPSFDVWFKNHAAVDGHGTPVPAVSREGLHLLHYESPNLAEFVRKWDAHRQDADRQARRRGANARKTQVAAAVVALLDNEALGADARQRLLRRVYERHVADPVDLLQELGYLVSLDPALHRHDPTPLPAARATQLNDVLDALRGVGKQRFTRRHVLDGNPRLRGTLRARHPELARELPLL
jgi:hypothetical protein